MPGLLTSYLANRVAASPLLPGRIRKAVLNLCGIKVKTISLNHSITFDGTNVTIEEGCFVNVGCHFDCTKERITIGKKTGVGPRVTFLTASHEIGDSQKRAGPSTHGPIQIGEGCWIGASSTILPGVKIGNGCLIAAGSVVVADCEENGLYAGVPAKKKRDL